LPMILDTIFSISSLFITLSKGVLIVSNSVISLFIFYWLLI
jgi:hypothetical protein